MQADVLIIGQGICGSFLSWELERAGLSYLVIDEVRPWAASRVAAGLINPVTGRRLVTTWMIDELLVSAKEAYGRWATVLGTSFLEPVSVTDFFPTVQMRLAFLQRLEEDGTYLRLPVDEQDWSDYFHYELGYGLISPCYLVDMPGLLDAARKRMREKGVLREERFERGELEVRPDGVNYGDIEARQVVFCDGIESFASPYFSRLPWAPNKGEVLIVDIPGLAERGVRQPDVGGVEQSGVGGAGRMDAGGVERTGADGVGRTIFKRGISLAPWREGLYWAGSSYEWSFETGGPTEGFRKKTEAALKEWVKLPFEVVDHFAAVRPATLERRPFVGFHPVYPAVGILNGMGTKGCSLAPYFARQLVDYLTMGRSIRPDADIRRFTKVLSKR
jgi:glycine/D-amino acid oxidase-like deaminating enzyme